MTPECASVTVERAQTVESGQPFNIHAAVSPPATQKTSRKLTPLIWKGGGQTGLRGLFEASGIQPQQQEQCLTHGKHLITLTLFLKESDSEQTGVKTASLKR